MTNGWLTEADRQVIDVARQIVEAWRNGQSVQDVLTRVGWSAATFGTNVARILNNPALRRLLGEATRKLLEQAVKIVGGEAIQAAAAAGLTLSSISLSTILWIGAGILIAAGLIYGGYVYVSGEKPVLPGTRMTGENCPPQTRTARKCPWTPEGYTVGECTPGFCWDGGPQGTLACKQENQRVPNAHLNDLNNLVCNDGFSNQVRDPCTGVLLRCE